MGYKNILFIDDDADDLELAVSAMQAIAGDYSYSTINSGIKALQKLEAKELIPDLIFLDLNMPLMSGLQFLEKIKANENLKTISIVILSTTSNPASIKASKELGAAGFITKPMSFSELVETLKSVVNKTHPMNSKF